MQKVINVGLIYNHIATPSVRVFPDLRRIAGINFRKKRWVIMRELDKAATNSLLRQGYGGQTEFIPQYETFDFQNFLPHVKKFPWINHDPNTEAPSRLTIADSASECSFRQPSLYVLEAWATRVLNLVHGGIISIEKRASKITGMHWKSMELSEQDLSVLLFKTEF